MNQLKEMLEAYRNGERGLPTYDELAAIPDGMIEAADFIDKRAEQYLQDYAESEPDTGAVVFNCGEAGREYHSVLVELADDLREASKPSACDVPPAGWKCTRAAGHKGPCAAISTAAKGE